MPGYSGPYCTTRCPYPTYGSRCQDIVTVAMTPVMCLLDAKSQQQV